MSNEDVGWRPGGPSGPGMRDSTGPEASGHSTIDSAKDKISDAAKAVTDNAKNAAQNAKDKAEELAERGKEAGADHIQGFAHVARSAAEDLEKQSPEIAGYVRQAADGLERAASSVRGRSVGEFVDMVDDFARRQPTAFFGSAVLAGFVLTRFIKSRASRPHASSGQRHSYMGADNQHSGSRGMGSGGLGQTSSVGQTGSDTRFGSGGLGQSTSSRPSSIGEMP